MSEITASRPEVVNGDIICSTSVSHILAVQKSTQLQIDTLIRHWICPYISRHLLSLNPLLACCRRYSRGER
ncbi:hypothetical protein AW072_04745 [Escherichia coli]|nr:hypothetical protein AW063_04740 [Escherichia coli]OTC08034.1 hypothetical protein AW072_04745 [Escherichia coli]